MASLPYRTLLISVPARESSAALACALAAAGLKSALPSAKRKSSGAGGLHVANRQAK